jgi:predicted nucleotidyltransferase
VDPDLASYLDRVVERLRDLDAVWLIGSAAMDAYVPGQSDVDAGGLLLVVLDLALARERGVSLHGPEPAELIGEVPRAAILDSLADSVDWYAREDPESPDALLNAERARRYVEEGVWSSKRQA